MSQDLCNRYVEEAIEIMKDFDVLFHVNEVYEDKIKKSKGKDIAVNNNQEKAKLPVPATYIIHRDGSISFVHFDFDYNNRATVKELISHLDKM